MSTRLSAGRVLAAYAFMTIRLADVTNTPFAKGIHRLHRRRRRRQGTLARLERSLIPFDSVGRDVLEEPSLGEKRLEQRFRRTHRQRVHRGFPGLCPSDVFWIYLVRSERVVVRPARL